MRIPSYLIYLGTLILILTPVFMMSRHQDQATIWELITADGFPVFIIFVLGGFGFIVYHNQKYTKSEAQWKSGFFDSKQSFSQDTLLQAYIRLGGLMLRKDQDDMKGKMAYLHRYFRQHFDDHQVDLMMALKSSFTHPVNLEVISPWLVHNLKSTSQRSQLIYFLAGLSTVDGSMNPKEKQYLQQLSDLLDLSKKDFDAIMAMYSKYEDTYKEQFRQHRAPSKSQRQYKIEKAANILGVSTQASVDEIKKAYRDLAKVHHPDRFATESESQQQIAKERFVQIQLAYELLIESKS